MIRAGLPAAEARDGDRRPEREGEVGDAQVILESSRAAEPVEAAGHLIPTARERHVIGEGEQQGSVMVAGAQPGLDLVCRSTRVGRVHDDRLLHDPLEDRQRPDDHPGIVPGRSPNRDR